MTAGTTTSAEHTAALSPHEAFVCILIASARSDGSISAHEANQIEHAVDGMRLFHGSTAGTRQDIITAAAERMAHRGTDLVIREAAAAIPPDLRPTVFAMAVDLMMSDGRWTATEERLADELRGLLEIDRELTTKIVDVLTIKNAG